MSKTNAQVQEAFGQGKAASNSRATLESRAPFNEPNYTFLTSYQTTIAIRRAKDGAEFHDAHHYSPTTSQHQRGHYDQPNFSFDCVAELIGPRWYETAHILDWGPRQCSNPECQRERDVQGEAFRVGLMKWYGDIFSKCWGLGDPQDRHDVTIPAYTNGHWPHVAAVLLSFDSRGQQVLCGFERGKALPPFGRTDQLWATILPFRVHDVVQAFEALKPSYVRNAEHSNAIGQTAEPRIRAEEVPTVAIHRQGDLYFVECPNGHGPPKAAVKLDGATLPPGERASHQANQVRVVFGDDAAQAFHAGTGVWRIWAKGNVDHPEHARLRLKGWHRVLQSAAVRGASSAYRHPMGGGSVGID